MKEIDEKLKLEVSDIIQKAMVDLDDFYSKIRKSHLILQYKNHGELLGEIYICILCSFSMMQILEFTSKSKMIENATGKELSRKERFIAGIDFFKYKFELFINQQLEQMS